MQMFSCAPWLQKGLVLAGCEILRMDVSNGSRAEDLTVWLTTADAILGCGEGVDVHEASSE